MNKKDLYILMLEDDPMDAEFNKLQLQHLEEYNCFTHWVMNKETYLKAVQELKFDLILSDYNLPQYNGLEALKDLHGLNQYIPFIFVTGTLNEETAAETIKAGAWDYVVKDRLIRLPLAIRGALQLKEERIQLKKAEQLNQKLSMAVEQSPSHILITDTDGYIEYINSRFTEVTGYSTEEAIGLKPSILKSGHHTKEFYATIWNTIKEGNIWRGELYNKKKDGTFFWESASISPLKNAEGIITHYVSVKEDITLRKKMEIEIIEARDKAEKSDKLKTAFLQNMSHEIRTPLNAIVGFSALINETDVQNEERNEYVNIILNSSNQLVSIVEDILTVSRIETRQELLNIRSIKINQLLKHLFTVYSIKAKDKNLEIILDEKLLNDETEIQTDDVKLTQILSNLLNNSLKFTHIGYLEFGYKLNDKHIEFFVKDTGIGIQEDMQSLIFERFAQAEISMSRNYGGNGLGLAICKAFVQLMGGKIWVISEFGKGSTFYFTLPLTQQNYENKQKNEFVDIKLKKKNATILVAEDEEFNYYLVEQILSKRNYIILHAENGLEAINMCKKHPEIKLVLMDIKMPEMDGQTALIEIRKDFPKLPIIAQTAYALEHEKEYLLNNGFNDYMAKPIKKAELIRKIENWLT
jgi:PAS domain S-box-containing protein